MKNLTPLKSLLPQRCLCLALIFFAITGVAQDQTSSPKNVKIASPNAASLGKVADIPVSYHTGIPNIDIPISTISAGPISLPIGLSYHAGGLKVMEQSSWVGAGWSLNAGGMITRSVRGVADDWTGTNATSWYLSNVAGNGGGYYDTYLDAQNHPDYYFFGTGQKDGESDLYFFNFGGYSGKFYFRADGTAVLLPQQDIKIVPYFCTSGMGGCTSSHELIGWTVTTPDGTRYYFGKTDKLAFNATPMIERTKTASFSSTSVPSYNPIASWYLFHVESSDSQFSVDLNYTSEQYGFFSMSLYPYAPTVSGSGTGWGLVKNLVDGIRLTSITFPNGTVTFNASGANRTDLSSFADNTIDNPNTSAKALQSIEIKGTVAGGLDKVFDLSTSYFTDTHTLQGTYGMSGFDPSAFVTDKKRLKLNSIQERSFDNSVTNPYHVFTYFDETSVPRTLSLGQDHWGFFNGVTTNSSMIPPYSLDGGATYTAGADREAHWPAMRAGALQKIQYPTGGTTEFEFEANENGFIRQYNTYVKGAQLTDQSAGFTGVGDTSPHYTNPLSAPSGKYFIDLNAPALYPGESGTLQIGNLNPIVFSSGSPYTSTVMTIPNGSYDIYVSVNGTLHSGYGAQAKIYEAVAVPHSDPTVIGGLRIKNIYQKTEGEQPVAQHFNYDSGSPQGVLFGRPDYVSLLRNDLWGDPGAPAGTNYTTRDASIAGGCKIDNPSPVAYAYFVSPGSVHPMQSTQGSHIGYNQVVVTRDDASATVYNYSYQQNLQTELSNRVINTSQCDPATPNYPPAPLPFDFHRGELVSQSMYDATSTLVKESKYASTYLPDAVGVSGLIVRGYGSYFPATEYEYLSAKKTMTSQLELMYNPLIPAQAPVGKLTETYFESVSHNLPTKSITWEVLSGNMVSNVVKGRALSENHSSYVADTYLYGCATEPLFDYNAVNAKSNALAVYNATPACTTFNCRFTRWLAYIQSVNTAWQNYRSQRRTYYNNLNTCMTDATRYFNAATEVKPLLDLISRYEITPPLETSHWRDGKFMGSSLFTYQYSASDRINIHPGTQFSITMPSPALSTVFTPVFTSQPITYTPDTTFPKSGLYQQEETYSFVNGNVVQVTEKSGIITSYIWGVNNMFPVVKAVGVSYSNLLTAYNAGGNFRASSLLANALVTTYAYDPLKGMISQTDPNNVTTYYTYDAIGRLESVKDNSQFVLKKMDYTYKTH